jgi:hypothetical protein
VLDLSNEQTAALVKFTEGGAANGCPFCQNRMAPEASPGDRLHFFEGLHAGCLATVSAHLSPVEGEFLVHVDGDLDTSLYRVLPSGSQFLREPSQPTPSWMCPLSLSDLDALEETAIRSLVRAFGSGARTIRVETAEALAAVSWSRRLPITGELLWPTLQNHGFNEDWKSEFCSLFDFGCSLLVGTHGRKPIKKKIVKQVAPG